jgi:hypothetical protein
MDQSGVLRVIATIKEAHTRPSAGEITIHFCPEGECKYSLTLTRGHPKSVTFATEDELLKFIAAFNAPLPAPGQEQEIHHRTAASN